MAGQARPGQDRSGRAHWDTGIVAAVAPRLWQIISSVYIYSQESHWKIIDPVATAPSVEDATSPRVCLSERASQPASQPASEREELASLLQMLARGMRVRMRAYDGTTCTVRMYVLGLFLHT